MHYKIIFFSAMLITNALSAQHTLVACGDDKVIIIDARRTSGTTASINWTWNASEAADLSPEYKKRMITLDECKPFNKGRSLLLTSSGGAVILLDVKTKKTLFNVVAPNAHSAELLPGKLVVVALSTHPKGNSLELYDLNRPEQVLWKDSLYSAHGVIWNKKNKRLYALGFDELRSYQFITVGKMQPKLKLERSWKLPDKGGHDLSVIDDQELLVSTHHNTFRFNLRYERFSIFEPLEGKHDIKSVNYYKKNRQVVYTQAEQSWWTYNIYLKNPEKKIHVPHIKLYKVRVLKWK